MRRRSPHDPDCERREEQEQARSDHREDGHGKLGKFYENYRLAERFYVKDDSMTVQKYIDSVAKTLGGKITIDSFVRYEKGEGLQKREDNLAEEVAKMTAGQ
ncbi:MAG: hypothetical protein ACLR5G_06020 [Eubacteriales bacterium]